MPKVFFRMPDGGLPIYGPCEQYAVVRFEEPHWRAYNMGVDWAGPTGAAKFIVPFFDFDTTYKFQPFLRRRIQEATSDGTFVIPFRPSGKHKIFSQTSLAGLAFFPEGHWDLGFHFEGNAKEIASQAFRMAHSALGDTSHPVGRAVQQSYEEKLARNPNQRLPDDDLKKLASDEILDAVPFQVHVV